MGHLVAVGLCPEFKQWSRRAARTGEGEVNIWTAGIFFFCYLRSVGIEESQGKLPPDAFNLAHEQIACLRE